ncbi:MAG: winged helix-turn-helix transcriptional regulator [Candidatus Marinimicrobia bacterium]|nr:winged helix-turn-helix transcriptional regulator [Candidatus Neomarinimicrobiota bacterium]
MRTEIKLFKALSDTNRIRILKMLEVRPLCVCEITEILGLAPSTVSKHLSLLRDTELIGDIKEGRWVNYHLQAGADDERVQQLLNLLAEWLPEDKIIKSDQQKAGEVDRNILCAS